MHITAAMNKPTLYHIPVCPFCQRPDSRLTLKGRRDEVDFRVIDITRQRPDWLLNKTGGTTALPLPGQRSGEGAPVPKFGESVRVGDGPVKVLQTNAGRMIFAKREEKD